MIINDSSVNVEVLKDTVGYTHNPSSKNLLANTATSATVQGITWTVNNDGSVTANGSTPASSYSSITVREKFWLPQGEYILSGSPEGASDNTYLLRMYNATRGYINDYGEGASFTSDGEYFNFAQIIIFKNTKVDNLTFYPMIRKTDITDDTYEKGTNDTVDNRLEILNNLLNTSLARSRVEVRSYTGQGRYTSEYNNPKPVSVTFSFAPKIVIALGYSHSRGATLISGRHIMIASELSTTYDAYKGFYCSDSTTPDYTYGKKSSDGKTFYWYTYHNNSSTGPSYQLDYRDFTYYFLAIE